MLAATVLLRAHEFERSLELLAEAHDLLQATGHGWLLAAHDLLLAWNLASLGRLEDADSAARSASNTSTPRARSCCSSLR